jgi:hypothetical protein
MAAPNTNRKEKENKDQLGPCDRSLEHRDKSPYMEDLSKLLKTVPDKILFWELATRQQRILARSLWEACNYKGQPKPGQFQDMEPEREYLEWVIRMDHDKQWRQAQKKR